MGMYSFLLIAIVIIILEAFMPLLIRKSECFGVMIPERFAEEPDIKQMKKQYAGQVLLFGSLMSLLAVALMAAFHVSEAKIALIFTGTLLLLLAMSFGIYLKYHRRMIDWKAEHVKAGAISLSRKVYVDTSFHRKKMVLPYAWFLIPFLIFLITVTVTWIYYPRAAAYLPAHFDLNGQVTQALPKSFLTAAMFPTLQLFMILTFMGLNWIIQKSKQITTYENPQESLIRSEHFRRIYSRAGFIMCVLMVLDFLVNQLTFLFHWPVAVMTIGSILLIIILFTGLFGLSYFVGQGGSRLKLGETKRSDTRTVRDDDQYWKLGIFYVNRHDPALFIEKRFGIGWTINMARPLAWVIFIGVIGAAILISVLFS
ncbi:DUF1648 domain-containing protein [Listeria ilorinensis]|uniref:DUF1648 domain-containing protein n=1 Tax=Listeria ilorinensis TaxID=2867439 RepID=UPI001EF4F651|nr:DUF5808 domain-containing protein [Listeria ilorinensis]